MFHLITSSLDNLVLAAQTLLYVDVVQPLLFRFNLMGYDEDTYDSLYWVIVGVVEVLAMYAVLRPLEALRPVEQWENRKAVRVDVIHTWITKLGILNLFFFLRCNRCSARCRHGCACTTSRTSSSTICGPGSPHGRSSRS
jgi:hypothetical protein